MDNIFSGKTQKEIEDMLIQMAVDSFADDPDITKEKIYDYFADVYTDQEQEVDHDLIESILEDAYYFARKAQLPDMP